MKLPPNAAFVTGSHAYGYPRHDSDIDLVVLVSKKDFRRLQEACDMEDNPEANNYISAGGVSLRFGKLNLLVCLGKGYYDVWRKGTKHLKVQAPVARDFACKYFQKLRKQAGFHVSSEPPPPQDIPF